MKKIDTILFDLDGTLVDSIELIYSSFKATFNKHFPELELEREKILTFIGPTLQDTFSSYTDDPFIIQDMINSYRNFYVEFETGNFKIYPNVIETMKKLKEQGFNLCIVTSKFKEAAWPSYTHFGLDKYFDAFVALDDVENPKPNREPIDLALSYFPNHKKAIMIGDTKGDIMAGNNAGIYSAGVAWSFKGAAHLIEANPNFMLANIEDIFRVIKQIEEE